MGSLDEIKSIIESLRSTTKRTEKIEILKVNKDNQLWVEVIKFLFDPMVTTGIASKKLEKYATITVSQEQDIDLLGMMDYLKRNNTGTAQDVQYVLGFVQRFPEHVEWLSQLFTKSLKLGIDATTINAVYGKNFIKVFTVMLAESYKNYPHQVDDKSFILTQKLDGCRCVAFVHEDGKVQFFTRNGQDYGEVPDVASDLIKIGKFGVAYDGELIADSRSSDTGEVFRQTISTANSKGIKTGLVYHVFDCLPIDDFMEGFCVARCTDRKEALHRIIRDAGELHWVEEVERLYEGDDKSKIDEWMKHALEHGWEGIMINVADAPYRNDRVKDLLKVKQFKTVDVRVTGVFEGTGALAGTLGGVDCEFDVDGKTYAVQCGSGFNRGQRDKYWSNPDLLIGKIVEIKCFEISQDVNGDYSLRFPIWLDIIRFDKDDTSVV